MLPSRWMRLDVLPKNANGKIDRPGLKKAFLDGEPYPSQIEVPSPGHIIAEETA
jgi:acyl-coenzyme A synthetase/AMP-(fatty) acid ligase